MLIIFQKSRYCHTTLGCNWPRTTTLAKLIAALQSYSPFVHATSSAHYCRYEVVLVANRAYYVLCDKPSIISAGSLQAANLPSSYLG